MADVLVDTSQASMVNAIEANLFAFFPHMAAWPRADVHDEPEFLWTRSATLDAVAPPDPRP